MVPLASPAAHSAPRRALQPQDKRPGERSVKKMHLGLSNGTAGHGRRRRRLWRARTPRVGPGDGFWPRRPWRAPSGSPARWAHVRAPAQAAGPTLRCVCGPSGPQNGLWRLRVGRPYPHMYAERGCALGQLKAGLRKSADRTLACVYSACRHASDLVGRSKAGGGQNRDFSTKRYGHRSTWSFTAFAR